LRDEYTPAIEPAGAFAAETLNLVQTLSDFVNQAYALTPAEIALMGQTQPARVSEERRRTWLVSLLASTGESALEQTARFPVAQRRMLAYTAGLGSVLRVVITFAVALGIHIGPDRPRRQRERVARVASGEERLECLYLTIRKLDWLGS
jgi:hypothetical protein